MRECRYYLILSRDLNYQNGTQLASRIEEVSRLLYTYAKTIGNDTGNK
ncbi:MAG TPA: hypothetical protein VER36_09020 [Flavisolibacter sp.]|nr:hypothetical protein [Flavisolibacter sp.]